jgi:ABC-type multidrug transport system fused ATPase/permease subunit
MIIRWVTKRRLQRQSAAIRRLSPLTTSLVSNAVRGFLELITFHAVRSMQVNYLRKTKQLYAVHSNQMVLGIAPARLYELLAVSALCVAIIISLFFGNAGPAFFESLSLLALSAYRIMPAMARINSRMIVMRGQMHLIEAMESGGLDRSESTSNHAPALTAPISIEINNLAAHYEGKEDLVFEGLQHRFESGKLSTIAGASGSGKSTLVNMILGLHDAHQGEIQIATGTQAQKLRSELSTYDWLRSVAYLPQQPFLFEGTVRENLTLGGAIQDIDEQHIAGLISSLQLTDALGAKPLDFKLQEGGSNLSGGQQQRLALIRALQLKRPVLILDEATSSLDQELASGVVRILEEEAARGTTVILITHDESISDKFDGIQLG